MRPEDPLTTAGFDGIALKPAEAELSRATALDASILAVDYEGREHVPDEGTLSALADVADVRVTTPVRADGFDPLGEDSHLRRLPDAVGRILVAGHPTYLSAEERQRAVAPRLGRARERAPEAWVGTEGVERLALAAGGTQFELLSAATERDVRALRAAGFQGEVAVYAPTVLADDEDVVLEAVAAYAARREPVDSVLPDDATVGAGAQGEAREILTKAVRDYALVGDPATVRDRIDRLREAGVDHVVGYPAAGLDRFLE